MLDPDKLAKFLKEKGARFYGASWCPHCRAQKDMFGDAAALLPYVECGTADGKGQAALCAEAEIRAYPTWVFPSGERFERKMTFLELKEKADPLDKLRSN